jgi:hypothetical protein
MKLRESFVFALLGCGVIATFGGLALVSRGESFGWLGVVLAAPMLFAVQRHMRVTSES